MVILLPWYVFFLYLSGIWCLELTARFMIPPTIFKFHLTIWIEHSLFSHIFYSLILELGKWWWSSLINMVHPNGGVLVYMHSSSVFLQIEYLMKLSNSNTPILSIRSEPYRILVICQLAVDFIVDPLVMSLLRLPTKSL